MAKRDPADEPFTSNYPPLDAWLREHGARCDWQIPYGPKSKSAAYLECWRCPGSAPFVILVRADRAGWDVYTPCHSAKVDETLADLERRIFAGGKPS
jgi:hypothetical protein